MADSFWPWPTVEWIRRVWRPHPSTVAPPAVARELVSAPAAIEPRGRGWGSWWPTIHEPFTGAWQRDIEATTSDLLTYPTVYACLTLIACDIGKLRIRLMSESTDGIWEEVFSPAFSPVLRKPNRYQTRIQFYEQWIRSKLTYGNTYVLKQRDERNVVIGMYVLDPSRVHPYLTEQGAVYYKATTDTLIGIDVPEVLIPAREIIHDPMVPLYHPLIGVSPISACGLAALQGLRMQKTSADFFANQARPGGVLTAPGAIEDATAARLKAYWDEKFSGSNTGRVAVLGDGLHYEGLTVNAVDAELIKQLAWTDEKICSVFHVPAYKVGVGEDPNYNNINALDQQYYAQCLQTLIESIELLLDEGLELPAPYGTAFDLDDLLRMDEASMIEAERNAIGAGIKAPNESRKRLNLPPVAGGATPYLQQQNSSLAALAIRDAREVAAGAAPPEPEEAEIPEAELEERVAAAIRAEVAA